MKAGKHVEGEAGMAGTAGMAGMMRCSKSRNFDLDITLVITLFYYTPITLLAHYTHWGITLPLHSDRGV